MRAPSAPAATLLIAVAGGLLMLVAEPATGLAVLAGTGAALLLPPRARSLVAAVVLLVGAVALVRAWLVHDPVLAVGACPVVVAATTAMLRSRGWAMPARDQAAAEQSPAPRPSPSSSSSRDTWEALSRGEDPTA